MSISTSARRSEAADNNDYENGIKYTKVRTSSLLHDLGPMNDNYASCNILERLVMAKLQAIISEIPYDMDKADVYGEGSSRFTILAAKASFSYFWKSPFWDIAAPHGGCQRIQRVQISRKASEFYLLTI